MTAEPIPLHLRPVRNMAADLGVKQRFRLLRVQSNDKRPVDAGWPERATDDVDVLSDWFSDKGPLYNIGVACGPQPNGVNLVVIDVDARHDGLARWASLLDINGHPDTAMHSTPSGGLHVFFDAPFEINNSGALGAGIDVRGVGGQVVIPPSMRNGGRYEAVPGRGLWEHRVQPLPEWLCDILQRPTRAEIAVSRSHHPANTLRAADGLLGNPEWLREQWNWVDELTQIGYVVITQRGERVFLAHPTATSEWSCTVDLDDGRMNAYSTNMPSPWREAQINRDGSVSWSPYDWFVAVNYNGDASAATREINRRRGGGRPERAAGTPSEAVDGPAQVDTTSLNLPAAFWDERPFLAHIFQAARATMASPDALLIASLARISALIPPAYKLPAVIGTLMGLDFMGCVVAETSGGKGLATGVARRLIPAPEENLDDAMVMMDVPVGSGEGLVQAFMVAEIDPATGKSNGKQRVGKQALHFTVDEGVALIAQGGREGATILATMCSAWSGEALGQMNANKQTRRVIPPGRVRVAAVMNMQTSNAWRLFEPQVAALGFTGRVVFASAHDPSSAADFERDIEWPGIWDVPQWSAYSLGVIELTYDPAIRVEIRAARQGVLDLSSTIDMLRSQYLLARCKLAGILAFVEDRQHVSISDWLLAGQILDASSRLLDHLIECRKSATSDLRHRQGEARGEIDDIADDVKGRRATARIAALILTKLGEPQTVGALNRALAGRDREYLDPALARLASDGLVTVLDDVVTKV